VHLQTRDYLQIPEQKMATLEADLRGPDQNIKSLEQQLYDNMKRTQTQTPTRKSSYYVNPTQSELKEPNHRRESSVERFTTQNML
jgi:hypothetical protein